jgi:hypothetical protein
VENITANGGNVSPVKVNADDANTVNNHSNVMKKHRSNLNLSDPHYYQNLLMSEALHLNRRSFYRPYYADPLLDRRYP